MQDKLFYFTKLQGNSQETGVHGREQRKKKKSGLIPTKHFFSLFPCLFRLPLLPSKTFHWSQNNGLNFGEHIKAAKKAVQGTILPKTDFQPKDGGRLCPETLLPTFLSPIQHSSI